MLARVWPSVRRTILEVHQKFVDSPPPWTRSPPTLLVHGELDTLVWHRHSVRLDARLTEQRVPHVFVSLPWATHAFEFNLSGPGGQVTTFAVEWFLAAVTK